MKKDGYFGSAELNKVLPKDTSEEYKVVNLEKRTSTRIVFHNFGLVDFKTLTIKQASFLVSKSFPFLEKKAKKNEKS